MPIKTPLFADKRVDLAPREPHAITVCERDRTHTHYVQKGWKSLFRCPSCGRSCFQALNFLGQRLMFCDGQRFSKKHKYELDLTAAPADASSH